MPRGTVRDVRRVIAGCLVLAILLFAGAQASTAMLPKTHHHDKDVAGQIILAVGYDATAPVHDNHCDHRLPCCIGGQCTANAHWIPVQTADLPHLTTLGVVGLPVGAALWSGIAVQPSSPPPRATV